MMNLTETTISPVRLLTLDSGTPYVSTTASPGVLGPGVHVLQRRLGRGEGGLLVRGGCRRPPEAGHLQEGTKDENTCQAVRVPMKQREHEFKRWTGLYLVLFFSAARGCRVRREPVVQPQTIVSERQRCTRRGCGSSDGMWLFSTDVVWRGDPTVVHVLDTFSRTSPSRVEGRC